jgi:hypothetical protein
MHLSKTLRAAVCAIPLLASACSATPPEDAIPEDERDGGMSVYLTGYSYWDNTPPGSAAIARPIIHDVAGGTGTYDDPITLAVGHSINGWSHTMDYPAGTRFYFPRIRKYAIVEDLCGDGNSPQDGPCHIGKSGRPWLDIYVDGQHAGSAEADACMYRITGFQTAYIHPAADRPVNPGPLTESGCRTFRP